MSANKIIKLETTDEARAWDQYAAVILAGVWACDAEILTMPAERIATEGADKMILERRKRLA